jgi:hypothetical protein
MEFDFAEDQKRLQRCCLELAADFATARPNISHRDTSQLVDKI